MLLKIISQNRFMIKGITTGRPEIKKNPLSKNNGQTLHNGTNKSRPKVLVGKFETLTPPPPTLAPVKVFIIYVVWVKYKCTLSAIKFHRSLHLIWRVTPAL